MSVRVSCSCNSLVQYSGFLSQSDPDSWTKTFELSETYQLSTATPLLITLYCQLYVYQLMLTLITEGLNICHSMTKTIICISLEHYQTAKVQSPQVAMIWCNSSFGYFTALLLCLNYWVSIKFLINSLSWERPLQFSQKFAHKNNKVPCKIYTFLCQLSYFK